MEARIGIGITVHNRNDIALKTISLFKTLLPDNCILVCVDDASTIPFEFANYRFDKNVGVSIAKNKCLHLLENCEHIMLIDDDLTPTNANWWQPYVNSGLNHACWNLNRPLIGKHDENVPAYWVYETPNGCMLYCTKKVLDVVGGWNTNFNGYGWDHPEWSSRIFNAGLTPARFIDIPNSKGLFEMANCESSFSSHDRMQIPNNFKLYQQNYYSKEFKPFK